MHYLCTLFKMPTCYWHSRDSHSTAIPAVCTCTYVRASGPFFLHQQKAVLHLFPARTTGQLFRTKYSLSAKTLFLYDHSDLLPQSKSVFLDLGLICSEASIDLRPVFAFFQNSLVVSWHPNFPISSLGHQAQLNVIPSHQCY